MGKRSTKETTFVKKARDYYPTIDPSAVSTLHGHLLPNTWFIEPCAGAGDLAKALVKKEHQCAAMYDIDPQWNLVVQRSCMSLSKYEVTRASCFITNPPFTWTMLQPIMNHLVSLLPTWLLLPADYVHNVRMGPYMKQCSKVVSIGRLYWEENKIKGVDNYVWLHLDKDHQGTTEFVGR